MSDSLLQPYESRIRSQSKQRDLQKGLSEPKLVRLALKTINDAMRQSIARELKVDAKVGVPTEPERIALEKHLGTKVTIVGDKFVWLEWDAMIAVKAAQEVLARQYPILNRQDKAVQSDYLITIEDPNTGRTAIFKPRSRATRKELDDAIEAEFAVDVDAQPF